MVRNQGNKTWVTKKWVADIARKLPDTSKLLKQDYLRLTVVGVFELDGPSIGVKLLSVGESGSQPVKVKTHRLEQAESTYVWEVFLPIKDYYNGIKRIPFSDLEPRLYGLFNALIEQTYQTHIKQQTKHSQQLQHTVYVGVTGYGSYRAQFYLKVKETDKSIWLLPLAKRHNSATVDAQNPIVEPDIDVDSGKQVIMRRKTSNGSIKISNYLYASLWDGKPIQELSD